MNTLKADYPKLVQTTTGDLAMLITQYMVDQHKWTKGPNLHWSQIQNPGFQKGSWVLSLRGNCVTWAETGISAAPKVASLREFISLIKDEPLKLGSELVYIEETGVRYGPNTKVAWDKIERIYERLTGKSVASGSATLKKALPQFIEVTSPELALAAAAYMKERHGFIRAPQLRGGDEQLLKQTAGVTLRLADKETRWYGAANCPVSRARTLVEFIGLVEDKPSQKINVGGYDCEFKDNGVQIGCQFVPIEMVKLVLDRKPKK